MPRKLAPPKYARHSSGQARVRIDGRVIYLGEYGSPASRDRYAREIAKWQSRQEATRTCLTVDHLALLFMEHAKGHYRKNGRPTSEIDCLRTALQYLVDVHGPTAVSDFGPKALKAVRQAMIDDERHCRNTINGHVSRIRRVFRWGVENEFVPPEVYHGLLAVQGLQQGRSEARETEPVAAVAVEAVNAVRPFVTPPVWAMIELQLLTGMRPGEVIIMRGCDITQAGRIWEYVPSDHKTEHHGKKRIIFLGPKAQAIVREFLKADTTAYLFSPRDVRGAVAGSSRQPGDFYDSDAYRNAVSRGCERAFGMPDELRNPDKGLHKLPKERRAAERAQRMRLAAEWRAEHCWHPNQLRHTMATRVRREAGIEPARAILGHSSVGTTEVYAERDADTARRVIELIG